MDTTHSAITNSVSAIKSRPAHDGVNDATISSTPHRSDNSGHIHTTPTVRIPPIESISGQTYALNAHPSLAATAGLYHFPVSAVESLRPIQTSELPSVQMSSFRTPDVAYPSYSTSRNPEIIGVNHVNPNLTQLDSQFYSSYENPLGRIGSGQSVEEDDDDDDDGDTSVCPTGAEHTGRWTKKEHELFLEALKKYGKEWKKVAAIVKTRTVVQTRTHAQKYFQKVQKFVHPDGVDGEGAFPVSTASTAPTATQTNKRSRLEMETATTTATSTERPAGGGAGDATSDDPAKAPADFDDDYFYYDTELPAHMRRPVDAGSVGGGAVPSQRTDPPPPSPASCGKRKAAEVAVAQALTGSASPIDMERGIHTLAMMKEAVLRPRRKGREVGAGTGRPSLGLSIINPDHLARTTKLEDEPSTPWDGEMQELEKRRKSSGMHVLVSTTAEQNEFISRVCAAAASGDVQGVAKLLEGATLSESLISTGPGVVRDLSLTETETNGNSRAASPAAARSSSMGPPTPTSSTKTIARRAVDNVEKSAAAPSASTGKSLVAELLNRVNDRGESALMIACHDSDGTYNTHSASSKNKVNGKEVQGEGRVSRQQRIIDICKLLVEHGASTTTINTQLQSCLHIAAQDGFELLARYLIRKGVPVNGTDINGDTPAHIAARHGHFSMLHVLNSSGANCHIRNKAARCALDCAQDCPDKGLTREEIRDSMLLMEPRLRSLILYHEDCLEHAARRESDWEGPDRLRGIMNLLLDDKEFPSHKVEISNQFEKAHVELLSRVHSSEYIAFVNSLSKKVQEEAGGSDGNTPPVPFTPHVQKTMMSRQEGDTKHPEACDTSFSGGTLKAARRAAGAVAHAVDRVLLGRSRNAFCVVRPPGHHAGYHGLLDGAKSCGFCIFNSVAAGALHALEAHHCERVAIIDIDVHHGM